MGATESKEENIIVAQQAQQIAPAVTKNSLESNDIIAACFVLAILAICAYFAWRCFKREIDLRIAKSNKSSRITNV